MWEAGALNVLVATPIFAAVCVYLRQLGLVEARPCLQLVVSFVASQRVDLKLEKVHLKPQKEKPVKWMKLNITTIHQKLFCSPHRWATGSRPHYLGDLHVVVRGLPSIITGLPLPLVADTLNKVLVEVADVEVPHLQCQQFQGHLRTSPLTNIQARIDSSTQRQDCQHVNSNTEAVKCLRGKLSLLWLSEESFQ